MTDGGGASRVPLEGILRLDEFEPLARGAMDAAAYAYYAGGAGDEITLRENRAAFERYRLLPRVLVDVSSVDPSTSILGIPVSMPIGIAPNAAQHLADKDAECATARAAASAGTLMCLSTFSSASSKLGMGSWRLKLRSQYRVGPAVPDGGCPAQPDLQSISM